VIKDKKAATDFTDGREMALKREIHEMVLQGF
jgi:hypothetical protein